MGNLTLYIALSLDGYIAKSDGSVDWLSIAEDPDEDYGYADFYASVDALLMGRHTCEQILSFGDWPYPDKPTYLVTSQTLADQAHDIVPLDRPLPEAMKQMRQSHRHIWLVGGGQLASALHVAGEIDDYRLFQLPVTLGTGIPLFLPQAQETPLKTQTVRQYPRGVVEIHYQQPDD